MLPVHGSALGHLLCFYPPTFSGIHPLFLQSRLLPLIGSTQPPAAEASLAVPYARNFPLVLLAFPSEGSTCFPQPLACRSVRETSALLCSKSPPKRSQGPHGVNIFHDISFQRLLSGSAPRADSASGFAASLPERHWCWEWGWILPSPCFPACPHAVSLPCRFQ